MSDHVPFEIQEEIMKRLPVKSLIQYRSVSKSWKSTIDSSDFIAAYSLCHSQPQRLLIRYEDPAELKHKYVSIVDDDTFLQQKLPTSVPLLDKLPDGGRMIGSSSRGLFCFFDCCESSISGKVVLWNPTIRKSVDIAVPNVRSCVVGFGVCPKTNDPKIVKITHKHMLWETEDIKCIPKQVEVFTLSSRTWRNPCSNLPRKSILFTWANVVTDGFIYWDAFEVDNDITYNHLIISFDLTSEEFREIYLPNNLSHGHFQLSKLRGSLVVTEHREEALEPVNCVWMMENGDSKSFTKLFNFSPPNKLIQLVLGFRLSGEPIVEMKYHRSGTAALAVYEPYSKRIIDVGIYGKSFLFSVNSYMETLLLLDH